MSLDLVIPGVITNAGHLPPAVDDDMQIPGALVIFEPGHPVADFAMSGIPAVGSPNTGPTAITTTTLPNVAAEVAADLLATSEANTKAVWADNSVAVQTSAPPINIKYERTAKGGLHISPAQSGQSSSVKSELRLSDAVKAYLYANPTHVYYLSFWYRITRADLINTGPYSALKREAGTSVGFFNIQRGGPTGITDLVGQGVPVGARNTVGLVHERLANQYDGTPALSNATTDFLAVLFGLAQVNGAYGDHARNKAMSAILYRVNLIDLTAAGKTYAEMAAIDDAMRAAAFADGGRYDDDSWTAPAVLWP